jgi:hypothetical protein
MLETLFQPIKIASMPSQTSWKYTQKLNSAAAQTYRPPEGLTLGEDPSQCFPGRNACNRRKAEFIILQW